MEQTYEIIIDGIKWSQIPYDLKKEVALKNKVATCVMGFCKRQIIRMESNDFLWFRSEFLSIYADLK